MQLDFEQFESYVYSKNNEQSDVIRNTYITSKKQEGFKTEIRAALLDEKEDVMRELAKGGDNTTILRFVLFALLESQNLVYWETKNEAIKAVQRAIERKEEDMALFFRNFYKGDPGAEEFEQLKNYFGSKFDLIAYLYFTRNPDKYLPIKQEKFDKIFTLLDIECDRLCRNVNWKTYCSFLNAVGEVRDALEDHYPKEGDISLLDAHSFLWVHLYEDYPNTVSGTDPQIDTQESQSEKYIETLAKARIGQGKYRKDMIAIWDGRCAVTNCGQTDVLRASHAKPWGDPSTTVEEAIDPYNGFLLTPNLDELFDKGYITFSDDGSIILSSKISPSDYKKLGVDEKMKLRFVDAKHLPYLRYHRSRFKG